MAKLIGRLLICLVLVGCGVFVGCGGPIKGPRFWWDDRNKEKLSDDYKLPDDLSAPATGDSSYDDSSAKKKSGDKADPDSEEVVESVEIDETLLNPDGSGQSSNNEFMQPPTSYDGASDPYDSTAGSPW